MSSAENDPSAATLRSAGARGASAAQITAIVLTYDEEVNIESCLESVAGWCREVLVVDSGSSDRTVERCGKYTDSVVYHPFEDSASQWNWALNHLPIRGEWILPLDADHVVSPELARQLCEVVINPEPGVDGYYSRHQYIFWGTPIRGFKPYGLRLFRKGRVRMDSSELVDFRFIVAGETRKLPAVLYEFNRKELSIDFWVDKHQKFSTRVAVEEVLRGSRQLEWSLRPRLRGGPDERIAWLKDRWYDLPLFVRPFLYFFYRYFVRGGFLDGPTGLLYHFMQAFWYRLMVDVKIAQLRRSLTRRELSLHDLKQSFAHKF